MTDLIASLFHALWNAYTDITPQAGRIHQRLAERGESVVHDHVALNTFADLSALNTWLLDESFALNDAGGVVKGGPHVLLAQSATWADQIPWPFAGGETCRIPSCSYEFAMRYVDSSTGDPFDRFVEGSADAIFESTDASRG